MVFNKKKPEVNEILRKNLVHRFKSPHLRRPWADFLIFDLIPGKGLKIF